jgi:hypothetical protein
MQAAAAALKPLLNHVVLPTLTQTGRDDDEFVGTNFQKDLLNTLV